MLIDKIVNVYMVWNNFFQNQWNVCCSFSYNIWIKQNILKKHRRGTENNKVCLDVRFCFTFYFVQKRSNVKKCTVLFSTDNVNSRKPQHEPGDLQFYDLWNIVKVRRFDSFPRLHKLAGCKEGRLSSGPTLTCSLSTGGQQFGLSIRST